MPNQILEFYLSDHFMLKCWERTIEKSALYKVLPFVDVCKEEKTFVVITPSFLISKGVIGRLNHCLILVLNYKLIKTGYWCSDPNYLNRTERKAAFQWLYT